MYHDKKETCTMQVFKILSESTKNKSIMVYVLRYINEEVYKTHNLKKQTVITNCI